MIRIFNLAQAGGEPAENRMKQLEFELQKLEYDEAGVKPGEEWAYLHPEDEESE